MSKCEFSLSCEANGISSKTAEVLKDQDLHVEEALKRLTQDDIAELDLTKAQTKLLAKAMIGLGAPDLTSEPADTKPITTTTEPCERSRSCGGLVDLKQSLPSTTPVASQLQGDPTRIDF